MDYTHPVDRLAFRLRKPVMVSAIVSAPVACVGVPWAIIQLFEANAWWVPVGISVALVVTLLQLGFLIDTLSERLRKSEDGR